MKNKPEVIHSIGAVFGGTGIGSIVYNAVKWGAYGQGSLKKLICLSYLKTDIPKKKIVSFPFLRYFGLPFRAIQMLLKLKSFNPYKYLDPFYDSFASKKLEKCDVYHGWRNHSLKCLKKAKKLGAVTIVESPNSHPLTARKLLNEESKRFGTGKIISNKKGIKRMIEEMEIADYVTAPSDFVYKSLVENGIPKEKILKIPYGVDITKFSDKKDKKDKKFRAIFVGSIQLRKGLQYLLKAWDELKLENSELIIVGRVWPDAHQVVSKYKNKPTIKFVGFADPREYYKQSDVFVFPTIEEGSALVTYEAMASGLPLITTFNSGTIARHGKEALITPLRDIPGLKKAIRDLYNNPNKVKKMGKASRKLVENYTWEDYGNNLIKVHKKILKAKN